MASFDVEGQSHGQWPLVYRDGTRKVRTWDHGRSIAVATGKFEKVFKKWHGQTLDGQLSVVSHS